MLNRRHFIASNLTAGAAIGLSAPHEPSHNLSPLCVFAKPLQWLSFDALADYLDEYDWDGIEATVRRGGQVEPEKIEELGRLVDSLDRCVTDVKGDGQVFARLIGQNMLQVPKPSADVLCSCMILIQCGHAECFIELG